MYPEIWKIQLDRINGLYKGNSKIRPTRLRIRLTNRCNLSCKFCIRNTFTKEKLDSTKELSEMDIIKLIDQFAKLGGKFVEITGDGEPCIRLNTLIRLMQRIKDKSLVGELTTNGTLFTKESINQIIEMGWDMVRFSIDGRRRIHDYLRGQKGSFDKAVKNMFLFNKLKKESEKGAPEMGINLVLTNKNYNEIGEILNLLKKADGTHLWLTPMILQSDSAKNLLLSEKEKKSFVNRLRKLIEVSKKYRIKNNLNDFYHIFSDLDSKKQGEKAKDKVNNKNIFEAKCFMPWSDMVVAEDGKVGPCFAFYFDKLNIQNKPLDKIWFSKDFDDARESLLKNKLGTYCKNCTCWWGPGEADVIRNQLSNRGNSVDSIKDEASMNSEERVISWLNGKKVGPYFLEIRPTERCNLVCLPCEKYAYRFEPSKFKSNNYKELDKETYFRLIDDASNLGVAKVLISGGGEPFVRKDIIDIMLRIKQLGMNGEVQTNGTLFNKDNIELLVRTSWDEITISLDAPTRKINNFLRGRGFDEVIRNIKLFNYFKKKYNTKKPKITIATILTNKNYTALPRMIKLCKKLKIDIFRLQRLIKRSGLCDELFLNPGQKRIFNSALPCLIKYAETLGVDNNLRDFLEEAETDNELEHEDKFYCFAPFHDLSIDYDGKARYCQMSPTMNETIVEKSLSDIWHGKEMDKFRKKMLNREFQNFCKDCCSPKMQHMKKINEVVKKSVKKFKK